MSIAELIIAGESLGIFEFYLPFIILFSILFGILQKTKIFGDKGKVINAVISVAVALFVMQYALSGILAPFFATYFASTLGILVAILGFLMVTYLMLAMFSEGGNMPDAGKYVKYVILIGVILSIATFISSGGLAIFPGINLGSGLAGFNFSMPFGLSTGDIAIIVLVILFIVILFFLLREGGGGKKGGGDLEIKGK
jgi:hypothetical protein